MKITNVECDFLLVEIAVPITGQEIDYGMLLVTVETDTGLRGTGIAREHDTQALAVRQSILNDIAPFLMRPDAPEMVPGNVWHEAAYEMVRDYMSPTGVVARATSAVDQALWDVWGQSLGQPIHKLLGGAQHDIEVYATFGLNFYTPDEEEEAARRLLSQGHTGFKLMGSDADRGRDISIDTGRVKRLREIVGDDARIILDGRNVYNLYNAIALARNLEPYNLAFFDEPVWGRDPDALQQMRLACPWMPLAGRSLDGNIWDNRDLVVNRALQVLGLNVLDQGGYTHSLKAAHLAEVFGVPVVTGGGWYLHNLQLLGAVPNGWMTEYHVLAQPVLETIFLDPVLPVGGRVKMPDKPGIGLTLNDDAVAAAKKRARVAVETGNHRRLPA